MFFFTAVTFPVFPVERAARRGSSSTEDEDEDDGETKASPGVVRRRRLRRNTAGSEDEVNRDALHFLNPAAESHTTSRLKPLKQ